MRFWIANKIHSFEEFLILEDSEAKAKVREDNNIEISLNDSGLRADSTIDTQDGFIEEETKATLRSTNQGEDIEM